MPTEITPTMTFTLPTTRSKVSKRWIDQRILIVGQGGLGKSTLFSHDDKTYYENTEGGIGHLSVVTPKDENGDQQPTRSWDELREHAAALYKASKNGTFPYETLVIDTLDAFLALAEADTVGWAKKKFTTIADNIKSIADCPEGTGWNRTKDLVQTSLKMLDQLPCALVLITHPKPTVVDAPTGKYSKETIAVWGQLGTWILGWTHHNLHIQASYTPGGLLIRQVRTTPVKELESKSHGLIVPDRWKWETPDLKAEYEYLRSLFD